MSNKSKFAQLLGRGLGSLDLRLLSFLKSCDMLTAKQLMEHEEWGLSRTQTYRSIQRIAPFLHKTMDGQLILNDSMLPTYQDLTAYLLDACQYFGTWIESDLGPAPRWDNVNILKETAEDILKIIEVSEALHKRQKKANR